MKKVSVVIPTYKCSNVVARAVRSVLNQTYADIEIIVVDDNIPNSDERALTEKAMSAFIDLDNVVYIKHEVNKNGAAARNTGIHYAHGEYIAFLDDDDWFLCNKIQKQVFYMEENPQYDATYCFAQTNGSVIPAIPYKGNVSKELLMLKSRMFTPTLFFRRGALLAIGGFNESFRRHQDYELLLRFFDAGYQMGCVEEVLTELGTNGSNQMQKQTDILQLKKQFLTIFAQQIENIDKCSHGFKRRVIALHYGHACLVLLHMHQFLTLIAVALKYIWYSPSCFISPFVPWAQSYFKKKFIQ